jgi:hypothetical protein
LCDCNKRTSSLLTISRVLVRLGRRILHYQRVYVGGCCSG